MLAKIRSRGGCGRTSIRGATSLAAFLLLGACGGGGGSGGGFPPPQSNDIVLKWNAVVLDAVLIDHTPPMAHLPGSDVAGAGLGVHGGPCRAARVLAMTHVAMYDALMSIEQTHDPILVSVPASGTASVRAAVAYAAFDVLSAMYPQQALRFFTALEADLDAIPDGAAKEEGIAVGAEVAYQVLAARQSDGSENEYPTNSPYTPSNDPGKHRVDPVNPGQGFLTPTWGLVEPVGIMDIGDHAVPAPPALTSLEYAIAYDDVKILGGDGIGTPSARTPDQLEIGIFWAYDGVPGCGPPPRLFNQIARTIALQEGNTEAENARLFAIANVAMCDAGIASWASKYDDDFWRPIIAIREADMGTGPSGLGDGNAATQGDVNWTPLGAPSTNRDTPNFTPPFPAYTSGHATFGGAFFRVLEHFYGTDDIAFTIGSDEYNGVNREDASSPTPRPVRTRSYTSFTQAAEENGRSRIYLGIHWEFDNVLGVAQGQGVADEVYATLAQPQ
jgi:hypothetical protein